MGHRLALILSTTVNKNENESGAKSQITISNDKQVGNRFPQWSGRGKNA